MRRRQEQGGSARVSMDVVDEPCFSGRTSNFEVLSFKLGSRSGVPDDANIGPRHSSASLNFVGRDQRNGAHRRSVPVFELSEACCCGKGPSPGELLVRRPIAALALVPKPLVLFTAGAVAGAIGKIFL